VPPADQAGAAPGLISAAACVEAAVADGLIPAGVLEIGSSAGVHGRTAAGCAEDAIFDLASLTKVLGAGLVAIRLVASGRLDLDDTVRHWVPDWHGADRADVRVRDLLTHTSGLPAHLPLYRHHAGADALVAASAETPLVVPPRTSAIYSDLGFIIVGRVLEAAGGAPLRGQVAETLSLLSDDAPRFGPVDDARVQPTGFSPWRGPIAGGDVHDDNAAAMGGVAGHAGLFGSARGTGDAARSVLRGLQGVDSPIAPSWAFRAFARRSPVPASSRALAWDTSLSTSSSGRFLSAHAIGHTGFTGTSIWIDPDRDLYVVLLTNRVAGRATGEDIARLRREVHEAIGQAWPVRRDG
jgi:CubicO group peptidase (beta-lactamase class C family)